MQINIDPAPQSLTPNEQRVRDLMDQGLHYFRIAAMLKISFDACRDIIYEIRKKECIIMGRIPNDEWADAYASYKSGTMTQTEIAKKLGITVQSVCQRFKKLSAIETQIFDKPAGTAVAEDAPITETNAAITETDKPVVMTEEHTKEVPKAVLAAVEDKITELEEMIRDNNELIKSKQEHNAKFIGRIHTLRTWLSEVQA